MENLGKIIFKKYIIKRFLGKGTFSKVFLGKNIIDNKLYAIKCENIFSKQQFLKDETFKLYNLKGFGIPEVITFGRSGNYRFLVQTLLGKSLKEIWLEKNGKLCFKDICLIAIQTLERIEFVHSKNYIHRDIKPENFLLGNPDNSILYLIDFGNARKYRSSKTGKHIKPIQIKRIFGTALFLSINASYGNQQSRRDDLESLGYMYILLAKGELPWKILKYINISLEELMWKTIRIKKYISMEDLCKDLPNEFCDYMKYVKKLNFESKPDYEYLRGLFKNILLRIDIFAWMYSNKLTVDNFKEYNSLAQNRDTQNKQSLKKRYSKKKCNILTNLDNYVFNKENTKEDKHKKLIINEQNIRDKCKKEKLLSISLTNSIGIEGIQYKTNNIKYIKNINIINNNLNNKTDINIHGDKKMKIPKFKEYTPRFHKNINSNILNDINNKTKNRININDNTQNNKFNKKNSCIKIINNINKNKMIIMKKKNNKNNIYNRMIMKSNDLSHHIEQNSGKNFSLNLINMNNNNDPKYI